MPTCTQCGKQAIYSLGDQPLCVDCFLKFQQAMQIRTNELAQMLNYLTDMSEATVGMYGILPRYKTSQPLIHQGHLTFHNIQVDRSVVGSINTGEVQRIDVAMNHIRTSGDQELVKALKEFTEAVIAETKLDAELKNQIIEQISFLATQSVLPKEKQQHSIVKVVLSHVKDTVSTIASLFDLWNRLQPLFERVLI